MPQKWFVYKENNQLGPFSLEELHRQTDAGELKAEDLVWSEGMPEWVKAGDLTEIFPKAETPPLPPAVPAIPAQSVQSSPPVPPPASATELDGPVDAKKRSPLKTVALIGGGVIALAVIAFIVLAIIEMVPPRKPIQLSNILVSEEYTEDYEAVNPASTFEKNVSDIHVTMTVDYAPRDTVLTGNWYMAEENEPFGTSDLVLPASSSTVAFSFESDEKWLPGFYRVEFRVGDELFGMTGFEITSPGLSIEERYPDYAVFKDIYYSIAYPPDWIYSHEEGKVIYFDLSSGNSFIMLSKIEKADYPALEDLLQHHLDDLTVNLYADIIDQVRVPALLHVDLLPVEYPAISIISEYEFNDLNYREWLVLVDYSAESGSFYLEYIYSETLDNYSMYLPFAEGIFDSITF
jgi:hypothetical protein